MPTREIVQIDEDLCDGCGLCIPNCVEGALQIIDGKAKLVSDVLCDGFGACLGTCPQDAITIIEREAAEFDEALAEELIRSRAIVEETPSQPPVQPEAHQGHHHAGHVCPGSQERSFARKTPQKVNMEPAAAGLQSELRTWPIQMHLLNPGAGYLKEADLLLCADCVPFAYADFHRDFVAGKVVAIGCPKLDDVQPYIEKLATIFTHQNLNSLTILFMQVPCCDGIIKIALQALRMSHVSIPLRIVQISLQGEVLDDRSFTDSAEVA